MSTTVTTTSDNNELTLEIPVWVQGKRKWVTGITKKTTFDDLIFALLVQADLLKPSDTTNSSSNSIAGYAIAEYLQSTPSNNPDSESSVITQRIIKGHSKVIKAYKTWQFDKLPLTILHLISTSSLIDENSSIAKFRSKIFRRFLSSKSSSSIETNPEESNHQKLLNNFHQNSNILEKQKRLLDYLDDKIHQAENPTVTLNDMSDVLTSKSNQHEQLTLATQLCNSILNIQEHIDEKTTNLSSIEQAISNELNQHYDTLPSLITLNINENNNSSSDLTKLKNSIYRSRELSRIQSKEMHDLDLSLREAEILLESKYDELKYLEYETSTPNLNLKKQSNSDEQQQIAYETVELNFNSMKEIDEDSGINSLTSDDSNHHSMPIMHQKMNSQLETLV